MNTMPPLTPAQDRAIDDLEALRKANDLRAYPRRVEALDALLSMALGCAVKTEVV